MVSYLVDNQYICINEEKGFCMCHVCPKKKHLAAKMAKCLIMKWAHLGSNQGPTDYESVALTN